MTPTAVDALAASKAAKITETETAVNAAKAAGETSCIVYDLFSENVTEIEAAGYTVTDETISGVIYYTIDWNTAV